MYSPSDEGVGKGSTITDDDVVITGEDDTSRDDITTMVLTTVTVAGSSGGHDIVGMTDVVLFVVLLGALVEVVDVITLSVVVVASLNELTVVDDGATLEICGLDMTT